MTDPLAVRPPCPVMLAKPTGAEVPIGSFQYEPKWDGFRALVFRTADGVLLQSRAEEDITYAFPEVVESAMALVPGTVLDSELALIRNGRVDFPALSARLRPRSEAGGNIAALAAAQPACLIAFDLIGLPGQDLRDQPFRHRRAGLEALDLPANIHITPATTDPDLARSWFARVAGAGLDGLMAKDLDGVYTPGVRSQLKVKPEHTVDAVVCGWRPHKLAAPDGSAQVGSLLLGLHDEAGGLHFIGSASSFSVAQRATFTAELAPLALGDDEPHPWRGEVSVRVPDEPNRWRRAGQGAPTFLVRPELVAEVRADGLEGPRLRHVARFLRWRPDRDPASCGYGQFPVPAPLSVDEVLGW